MGEYAETIKGEKMLQVKTLEEGPLIPWVGRCDIISRKPSLGVGLYILP